jgi:subtilisin family serine protease
MRRLWILLFALPLFGQAVPDHYIVELDGEPAIALRGTRRFDQRRSELRTVQQRMRKSLEAESAQILGGLDTIANALIVSIPDSRARRLSSIPGVVRVSRVYRTKLALDRAVAIHHIIEAWNRLPVPGKAGAGVKIGIIDSGIDPDHPGFQDSSLDMPLGYPIPPARPQGFEGRNKIIVARSYDYMHGADAGVRDMEGHGTAVAMVAAGVYHAAPLASSSGAAPKAYLGMYEVPLYTDSMLKALDDAVADGMDIVNISMGTTVPLRPGVDPVMEAAERAAAAGVIVVASAGNEGPGLNSISSPGSAPSVVAVGAIFNDRLFSTTLQVQNGPTYLSFPGDAAWRVETATGPLFDVSTADPEGTGCGGYPADLLTGRIALILRGICTFEEKITNAASAGAIGAVIYNHEAGRDLFRMSVGAATLPAQSVSWADGLNLKERFKADPDLTLTLKRGLVAVPQDPNRLASFSSAGPSSSDGLKPDLIAVGTDVYTAAQKANPDGDVYDPSGYRSVDGTSFSSPLVAGSFAVLKSARPGLTAAQYRSLMINSSAGFVVSGTNVPVQRAGAGLLNLDAAMRRRSRLIRRRSASVSAGGRRSPHVS